MAYAILNGSRPASMTPTQANAYIANRLGVASVPTPAPGTATISRPVAPVAPVAPAIYRPPTTALPQPAFPTSSPPVMAAPPVPTPPPTSVVGAVPLAPGTSHTIFQTSNTTPDVVANQPATGYQEPIGYSQTLPVVSIPSPSDVGTPQASNVQFGLTDNTWLLILIAAALVLFLGSK